MPENKEEGEVLEKLFEKKGILEPSADKKKETTGKETQEKTKEHAEAEKKMTQALQRAAELERKLQEKEGETREPTADEALDIAEDYLLDAENDVASAVSTQNAEEYEVANKRVLECKAAIRQLNKMKRKQERESVKSNQEKEEKNKQLSSKFKELEKEYGKEVAEQVREYLNENDVDPIRVLFERFSETAPTPPYRIPGGGSFRPDNKKAPEGSIDLTEVFKALGKKTILH